MATLSLNIHFMCLNKQVILFDPLNGISALLLINKLENILQSQCVLLCQ